MTIKEVESRTELVRANIRYYESQGLISPVRRENGYREYTQQDVDTLLKIKLLRQLRFSMEEIQALQKGERDLALVLDQKLRELKLAQEELEDAARVCRELRQDQASYATLDAAHYLKRCTPPADVLKQDELPHYIFPWRRYFARTLDILFYNTIFTLLLQFLFRINVLREEAVFWRTLIPLLLMLGGESLMLTLCGTTPGKALLGLKLVQADGSPLTLEQSFWRTSRVMLLFGGCQLMALLPPLFVLIAVGLEIYACVCVYHARPLPWERDDILYLEGSTREKRFWDWDSIFIALRIGGYVAAFGLCIALTVGGHLWASTPYYHGEQLQASQFADNYNQIHRFLRGRNNITYEMDGTGGLQELPQPPGTFHVDFWGGLGLDPVFRLEQKNGFLTKVTLLCPRGDEPEFFGIPRTEMTVSAYAFLWHDLGRTQIVELIEAMNQQYEDFHYSYPNVEVDCRMNDGGTFVFTMTRT